MNWNWKSDTGESYPYLTPTSKRQSNPFLAEPFTPATLPNELLWRDQPASQALEITKHSQNNSLFPEPPRPKPLLSDLPPYATPLREITMKGGVQELGRVDGRGNILGLYDNRPTHMTVGPCGVIQDICGRSTGMQVDSLGFVRPLVR